MSSLSGRPQAGRSSAQGTGPELFDLRE